MPVLQVKTDPVSENYYYDSQYLQLLLLIVSVYMYRYLLITTCLYSYKVKGLLFVYKHITCVRIYNPKIEFDMPVLCGKDTHGA